MTIASVLSSNSGNWESAEDLKVLMHQQAQSWRKERVQMLYLLQSSQASSVTHAAGLLGRGRITAITLVGGL